MLWDVRNENVHGGRKWTVQDLICRVRKLSREHLEAWRKKLQPGPGVRWSPPRESFIKINTDFAILEEFGMAAAIAWDCGGQIQGASVKRLDVVDPVEGEAEAVKLGVQLACDLGFENVIFEGDSEIVIMAINAWPYLSNWRIYSSVKEIHAACWGQKKWLAVHAVRNANELTHHFAR